LAHESIEKSGLPLGFAGTKCVDRFADILFHQPDKVTQPGFPVEANKTMHVIGHDHIAANASTVGYIDLGV